MSEKKDPKKLQNTGNNNHTPGNNRTHAKKKTMDKSTKIKFLIQSGKVLFRFYGLFALFIGIGYLLSRWDHSFLIFGHSLNFKNFIIRTFPEFLAQSVGFVSTLLGIQVTVSGENVHFLTFNTFGYSIISDCAGYFVMLIYSAAVIAFPSRITDKILGLALGVPSLYFINITRLVFIGLVCSKYKKLFNYLHEYLWQGIFIFFVLGLWIVWRQYIVRDDVPITRLLDKETP